MSAISIPKGSIQLAGLLFKPATPSTPKLPALIIVHPGGGVKEQTAGLYARNLSQHGYMTVCYDASHQGESGGEPRFLEDPSQRVSDVYSVIDYLEKCDDVDSEKIAIVGICAGGGYATAAAKSDHRLKALATISMVNIGDSARLGWDGTEDPKQKLDAFTFAAEQISAENAGAESAVAPYFADLYLTQPTLLIAGEKAGSLWHTEKLDHLIGGTAKKVIVPSATHIDFYDQEEYVDLAVKNMVEFFGENL